MRIRSKTYWSDIAGPASLYRIYAGERLLYIGVSMHPERRLEQHAAKPWFIGVTRFDVERFDTRAEAFAAEKQAIIHERPEANIALPKEALR